MGERLRDDATASQSKGPRGSALGDYAALEAVLSATPRGRWFLSEYARRNRRAETGMLLGAMSKLETAVLGEQSENALHAIFVELAEISEAVVRRRCAAHERGERGLCSVNATLESMLEPVTVVSETFHSIWQRINFLIEIWKAGEIKEKTDDAEGPRQPSNENVAGD